MMAFKILEPCHRTWSSLEGEGSVRHCDDCQHKVYDLSNFTERELRRRLAGGERICGVEGTQPRRNIFVWAYAALSAMRLQAQQLKLRINWYFTLRDPGGSPIPNWAVVIKLNGGETTITTRTTNEGTVALDFDWFSGVSIFIEANGFAPTRFRLYDPPTQFYSVTLGVNVNNEPPIGLVVREERLQTEIRPKLTPRQLNEMRPKPMRRQINFFGRIFRRPKR